jgi:hypothetical protein
MTAPLSDEHLARIKAMRGLPLRAHVVIQRLLAEVDRLREQRPLGYAVVYNHRPDPHVAYNGLIFPTVDEARVARRRFAGTPHYDSGGVPICAVTILEEG